MTQPDQYFPDTAVNALSFADYAATTEAEWEAQMRDGVASHFSLAELGFSAILELLTNIPIIGELIEALIGFLGGEGTGLESLIGLLESIPIVGQIIQLFTGLAPIDGLGGGTLGLDGLEQLPLIGPVLSFLMGLVNGLVTFLSGGGTPDGGDNSALNTLFGLFEQIPLVGTLINLLSPVINPLLQPLNLVFGIFGGALNFLGSIIGGLLSFFSFGLLGGTLGGIQIGGPGGAAEGLSYALEHAGMITTNNPIVPHQLATLAPGKTGNLQPDPEFDLGFQTMNGQGRWTIDIIGPGGQYGHNFCVRTMRRGLITVYALEGTMEMQAGSPTPENWADVREYWEGYQGMYGPIPSHFCDTTKFELVRVPYAAALFPLQSSVTEATQRLIGLIRQTPGPFILWGASLGTIAMSNVLDELRFGTLKDRYDDLLLGLANANIRREQGTGFPDKHNPGQYLVYDTQGFGVFMPVLTGTKEPGLRERWWELAFPAGTFAGKGSLTGFNLTAADPFACMPDSQLGRDCRAAIQEIKNRPNFSLSSMANANSALLGGLTPGATGHGIGWGQHQPWLHLGDTTTMDDYHWDTIRGFGDTFTPPDFQDDRDLEGVHVPVKDGQIITTGAALCWMGMGAPLSPDPVIAVRVNLFDAQHRYLETLWSDAATIVEPSLASSDWIRVQGEYLVTNNNAQYACINLWTSDAWNKTSITWFAQCTISTPAQLDAALLGNMENAAQAFLDKVSGAQGEPDLAQSMKTMIDGIASAASQSTKKNVTYAEAFDLLQDAIMTAYNTQNLGQQHDARLEEIEALLEILGPGTYHPPATLNWPEPGQYVWDIPLHARGAGDVFDVVLLGGGGGAGGWKAGSPGQGGTYARYTKVTLIMGTHIPLGTTQLVINVGIGGAGGGQDVNGQDGTDSWIAVFDGPTLATSAGGQHGNAGVAWNPLNKNYSWQGQGPGNTDFYGITYFGGQLVGVWDAGTPGGFPGGGGASPAGPGASGKVWISLGRVP